MSAQSSLSSRVRAMIVPNMPPEPYDIMPNAFEILLMVVGIVLASTMSYYLLSIEVPDDVDPAAEEKGAALFKAWLRDEDVVERESGLLYKVVRKGPEEKQRFVPAKHADVLVHYDGYVHDRRFDSSSDRGGPTKFAPKQLVPGCYKWQNNRGGPQ